MISPKQSDLLSRLAAVFKLPTENIERDLHPDFIRYFRRFIITGDDPYSYFEELFRHKDQARWHGRILDIACGYGVTSVALRAAGVASVVGLDISEIKISTANRLLQITDADDCLFVQGSAERLPFFEQQFEGVLLKDAVSHFPPNTSVFREIYKVLKQRGSLFIEDDRNALNQSVRKTTRQIWEISEFGTEEQLSTLGMHRSLCEMRKDFIRTHFPDLSNETCDELARASRGYLNKQLPAFVKSRQEGGSTPKPYAECVNPETGVVQERLINPLALAKQLREIGFRVRLVKPTAWRTKPTSAKAFFKRMAAISCWPYTISLCTEFHVVAIKR
jgi:ubiquinone/menaquinone biosynthesis C-methylase UbiE